MGPAQYSDGDEEQQPRQQNLPLSWDGSGGKAGASASGSETGALGTSEAPRLVQPKHDTAPTRADAAPEQALTEPEDEGAPEILGGTADEGDDDRPPGEGDGEPVYRLADDDMAPGEFLREVREQRGLTLEQAADSAGVPRTFVRMIESDAPGDLPAVHYVKTYLRKLCLLYGIDESRTFERFAAVIAQAETPPEGRFQLAPTSEGVGGKVVYRFPTAVDEADDSARRRWSRLFVGLALALVLILGAAGFAVQWWRASKVSTTANETAEPASRTHVLDVERYLPPQQLPLKELPVP